jgi:hypothetical protein
MMSLSTDCLREISVMDDSVPTVDCFRYSRQYSVEIDDEFFLYAFMTWPSVREPLLRYVSRSVSLLHMSKLEVRMVAPFATARAIS